jgi:flagellar FliL protein
MADMEKEEQEVVEAPKKGKKKLVILLVASILGSGGAFAGMKMMGGGGSEEPPPAAAVPAVALDPSDPTTAGPPPGGPGGRGAGQPEPALGPIVILDPFVVNLNEAGRARYLKLSIELELQSQTNQPVNAPLPPINDELEQRKPQIRHTLITYLSSLRVQDTKGPAAKLEICEDIRRRINNLVKTGAIKNVYLTDFVVK